MLETISYQPRNKRIGLIVPASNTNAEPDCVSLCPPNVTVHSARSGGYDVEDIPDSTEMRRFARQSLDQNCKDLVDARVDIIAYGCTSATLSEGPEFDESFCKSIQAEAGRPAVTTAGALIEAIESIQAAKISFTSPYVKALSQEAVQFLAKCDIETVKEHALERELNSLEQNALTPQDAYNMAMEADCSEAQAIVISCTDFRALEAVPAIERVLNKPVITRKQALMFACLKRMDVSLAKVRNGGFLFTGSGIDHER